MSEIIERVAKALCQADGCDPDHESADPSDSGIKLWTRYERDARAAIEAMREPTEAMTEAGYFHGDVGSAIPVWQAMIDAALKDLA